MKNRVIILLLLILNFGCNSQPKKKDKPINKDEVVHLKDTVEKDTFKTFKYLRKTKHTHNPVDDAKGNAEALLTMKKEFGLKIKF